MHNNSEFKYPRFPRKTAPNKVFSTWEIHYACNYYCTYCHAPKPWHPNIGNASYLSVREWTTIWKDLYDRYDSWYILITGGEPFIYPNFIELIKELTKFHFIEFCTNLSWEVEQFINNIEPARCKVGTSFHPEFADIDIFLKKIRALKENRFNLTVNFVPAPISLSKMAEYKSRFEEIDVQFVLQPFIGEYEGRRYPQGYTSQEREYFKIFKDDCNLNTLTFKTTEKSSLTKGRLCRMGENYAFIHPNGDAHRCCKDKSILLGNIIKGTFKLLEEPACCTVEECNCWRCMLAGKEEEWGRHWKSPSIFEEINNIDIILLQCPVWGIFDPPIALAQLSSCLKEKGFKIRVVDLNIELYKTHIGNYRTAWAIEQSSFWCNKENVSKFFIDNSDIVEKWINEMIIDNPIAIGFSVNNASFYSTIEFSRRIKQKNPRIKIVIGGPMFLVPADLQSIFLDNDCIDIIVLSEGEESVIDLISILRDGKDINLCQGIAYKKNGKVIITESRPLIKELDKLPFLDFTDLALNRYEPPGHLGKHISIMTSRGCIQGCVFCGPKSYWFGYRSMSGKRIYEEIKYHIQKITDIAHIEFLDLLFNGNMETLDEFCEFMRSAPIKPNLRWHANVIIRPEMTYELLLKMKNAGCHHLTYGIESGSQRILDIMRKRYKIEDADNVLRATHEAGIDVTCNFMFGFPGETEEDFQQTLNFLMRNSKYITTAYPSRTYCTIEPYSYLEKHMEEFGIVPNTTNNIYWESKDGANTFHERLKRCEIFTSAASSLGISVGSGLQTSIDLDRLYNLGFYYDSKKDYKNAAKCFSEYLAIDPRNEVIVNRLENIKQKEINSNPANIINDNIKYKAHHISFNWDIQWICNYRCPYCWFYDKWAELGSRNRVLSVKELFNAWSRINAKYGMVKISITGGEPFLYPNFTDLIKELSQIHKVEIITNLSVDIKNFIKDINYENVKVNPSFHPLFANFEKFTERILILKENNLLECISYLAWPPQISKIPYYIEKFKYYGITIAIQSFFGKYKDLRYPEAYTDEEKQIILPQIGKRGDRPFQTGPMKTRGKLCFAGCRYGVIHPDGTVLKCGGMNSCDGAPKIGNIFEEGFSLLSEPSACSFEICPCNEWAFLLQ